MRRLIAQRCDTPYMSYIDWDKDLIFIKNPRDISVNIGGYKINTKDGDFEYIFPKDYTISSHSTILLNFHPDDTVSDTDLSDSYYFCNDKLEINDSQMQEIKKDNNNNTIDNITMSLYDSSLKQKRISKLKYKIISINNEDGEEDDDNMIKFELELSYFDWMLTTIMLSLCYLKISIIFAMVYSIIKHQYFIFSILWGIILILELIETTTVPTLSSMFSSSCSSSAVVDENNENNTLEIAISRGAYRIFNSIIYFALLFAANNNNSSDGSSGSSDNLLLGIGIDMNSSSIVGIILAIELFSEELYQNRIKISVYRDTLDALLQHTTLLPSFTYFASHLYLLVEYTRHMNYTFYDYIQFFTSIFYLNNIINVEQYEFNNSSSSSVDTDNDYVWIFLYLLLRSAFLCRFVAYTLQMIDATVSIGKFS